MISNYFVKGQRLSAQQIQGHSKSAQACRAGLAHAQRSPQDESRIQSMLKKGSVALVSSVMALTLASGTALAHPNTTTIRVPHVQPIVQQAQHTLLEAWQYVALMFYDRDFNNINWTDKLSESLIAQADKPTKEEAYSTIQSMLESLGDQYTRIEQPEQYMQFKVDSDGELQGVGIMLGSDMSTGRLFVLAPLKGGPAEKAGIIAGDEVVGINGEDTVGWTGERAASKLRGQRGTKVTLQIRQVASQDTSGDGQFADGPVKTVSLQRERVVLSPVRYTVLPTLAGKVGYIQLNNFTQNAAGEMQEAIVNLKENGAQGFILDLRNNPGGLVTAAMDISRLWLDGGDTVVNIQDSSSLTPTMALDSAGGSQASVSEALSFAPAGQSLVHKVFIKEGDAFVHDPLAVIINKNSASAAEILAGALHDNGRGVLVGPSHSFGKGKIQTVFQLSDGSALYVTVSKYVTPNFSEIDDKGIDPDLACTFKAPKAAGDFQQGRRVLEGTVRIVADLDSDPCVSSAESALQHQLWTWHNDRRSTIPIQQKFTLKASSGQVDEDQLTSFAPGAKGNEQ